MEMNFGSLGPALLIAALLLNAETSIHCQDTSQFHSRRQLHPLETYKDAQIFRYNIPEEALVATWKLWSNGTYGCDARRVTFHLRWRGYPVVNSPNTSFPRNFVNDLSEQYTITLRSDSKLVTFNLSTPLPGEWFGVAYTEKIENRILQRGLLMQCNVWLTSFLSFTTLNKEQDILFLSPSVPLAQLLTHQKIFKFFLTAQTLSAKVNITKCSQSPKSSRGYECPIIVYHRGLSLPKNDSHDYAYDCKLKYNHDHGCHVDNLFVTRDAWNYILIEPSFEEDDGAVFVEFELLLLLEECIDGSPTMLTTKTVHRTQTVAPPSTTTKYPYPTTTSSEASAETEDTTLALQTHAAHNLRHTLKYSAQNTNVQICPDKINLMRYNLPGNFAFKYDKPISIPINDSYSPFMDIVNSNPTNIVVTMLEFEVLPLIDSGGNLIIDLAMDPSINTTYHNVSVGFCLNYNHYSKHFDDCLKYTEVHSSSYTTWNKTVVIPYPRSGHWFITLRSNCTYFVREGGTMNPVNCEFKTTPIFLDIKLSSCNLGQCGKYGRCYHLINDGVVYSSCVCQSGWKGWWCEDNKEAFNDDELLLNFLLLTLSNIVFVPSVILSAYRKHFTEALVYLTTMLSSSLYHACDTESVHVYCILKVNILQFADFYSALLAFWVSLITLANLEDRTKAFLHMFGAIFIGLLVQFDRTSIWAFAIPSGLGLFILTIAWICHCGHKRSCFPSGKLWLTSVIPGLALAIGGLVLYALFETKENYGLTHSCWHIVMALALFLLIPSMKNEICEEEEDFRGKGSNETYYELIAEEGSHLARHPLT